MKVLLINGSRRAKGCTYTALGVIGDELAARGVDSEMVHVTDEGAEDLALDLVNTCDAMVIGSPVYYASPSGEVELFLDHLFGRASYAQLAHKPCAVVATARRAGTTATLDALAKYPTIAEMPLVSSSYWCEVHGNTPEEVLRDEEGVSTMRRLGQNMAWMLECIEAGKAAGVEAPEQEKKARTNFIR